MCGYLGIPLATNVASEEILLDTTGLNKLFYEIVSFSPTILILTYCVSDTLAHAHNTQILSPLSHSRCISHKCRFFLLSLSLSLFHIQSNSDITNSSGPAELFVITGLIYVVK